MGYWGRSASGYLSKGFLLHQQLRIDPCIPTGSLLVNIIAEREKESTAFH
jgi:hypothetical protein